YGIPEDPATGSGNAALAGFLASLRPEPDLKLDLRIAQGIEMGRPSLLEASAEKKNGHLTGMWIGGRCVTKVRGGLDFEVASGSREIQRSPTPRHVGSRVELDPTYSSH